MIYVDKWGNIGSREERDRQKIKKVGHFLENIN